MSRVTISDVAARANVTKSTVSHALSGKRPVAPETRQRIEQAIAELGYRPHAVAQRLAGGRSRAIGLAYPLYSPQLTGLETKFIVGAANVINQADYAFVLLTQSERRSDKLADFVLDGLLDGVILMQMRAHDERVALLREAEIPFVSVGRSMEPEDLVFVDLNIEAAIATCVEHLIALGHRHIAYLHQDDPGFSFVALATQAYGDACRRHGIADIRKSCGLSLDCGRASTEALLGDHPEVTAIIAWTDVVAHGAIHAVRERGLSVPQDLSVICFEGSIQTSLDSLRMTTIDIRAEEMAALAAQMLLAMLEDRPLAEPRLLLAPKLIKGDTTALPRVLK